MNQEKMTEMLQGLITGRRIAGAALRVRQKGDIIYDQCFGVGNIQTQAAVTERSIFRAASLTKLIVSVAAMMLVEEGTLSLDDDLVKFFPKYPEEKRKVSVRHLLNHSSSLGQGPGSEAYYEKVFDIHDDLKRRTDKWGDMPFDCEPGETADYNAFVGFELLGRILELVSGKNLEDFLREKLLLPLGMTDTVFVLSQEQNTRLVSLYEQQEGELVFISDDNPFSDRATSKYGYFSGAAGLYTTLHDYDRFTAMLCAGGIWEDCRIIGEDTLKLMVTPRQITNIELREGCPWGLGFRIFEHPEKSGFPVLPGTFGWSGAYGTHMFVHRETGLAATLMINQTDLGGAISFISRDVERIVFEEYMGGNDL